MIVACILSPGVDLTRGKRSDHNRGTLGVADISNSFGRYCSIVPPELFPYERRYRLGRYCRDLQYIEAGSSADLAKERQEMMFGNQSRHRRRDD